MKHNNYSAAFLRKRKLLVVLPLIVIPFLTMAFWALGGGRSNAVEKQATGDFRGLNFRLPASSVDKQFADKMAFYEQAEKDSLKQEKVWSQDPNYTTGALPGELSLKQRKLHPYPLGTLSGSTDPNEEKVMQKIKLLNAAINKPVSQHRILEAQTTQKDEAFTSSVDQLGHMMDVMNKNEGTEDPEIKKLEGMLDKIIDIQHPERLKENTKTAVTSKKEVLAVEAPDASCVVSLLQYPDSVLPVSIRSKGFYGWNGMLTETITSHAIIAAVHETQTLVNGSTVKMRLLQDILINGVTIPEGTFVYGTVSLKNERLEVEVSSIQYKNNLFPVKLVGYDLDGIAGLYIPGSINRDVAKQSADKAVQSIGMTSLNPTITEQAAA